MKTKPQSKTYQYLILLNELEKKHVYNLQSGKTGRIYGLKQTLYMTFLVHFSCHPIVATSRSDTHIFHRCRCTFSSSSITRCYISHSYEAGCYSLGFRLQKSNTSPQNKKTL